MNVADSFTIALETNGSKRKPARKKGRVLSTPGLLVKMQGMRNEWRDLGYHHQQFNQREALFKGR